MIKMKSRGFTLIELLVVISVIGLLSTIILAALSGARQKGQVAAVQEFVDNDYHVLGTSLIAWYGFNDAPTSGTWSTTADLSGNNNVANIPFSLPAVSTTTSYAPSAGSAISFSRSTQDVSSITPTLPFNSTGITISMWIKLSQVTPGGSIFYDSVTGISLTLGSLGSNVCAVGSTNEDTSLNNGVKSICDGNWHNITYTSGNNSSRTEVNVIYVDGKQDSSVAGSFPFLGNQASDLCGCILPQTMNADIKNGGTNWVGYSYSIDDLMIFDQALGFSGIVSLYDRGAIKHGLTLK